MTFSAVRMQFVGKQRVKASQFLLALGGEGWSHWSIVSHSGDHSCIVAHIPCVCVLSCFSHVWLLATPWTVACQVPLSVGFSEWEYWSGLPCPPPWDLPDPRIEPTSPLSPALAGGSFTTSATQEVSAFRWCLKKTKTKTPYSQVAGEGPEATAFRTH